MTFNVQHYSTHDDPGICAIVFLKDCSLGCHWHQNPEGRARTQDLLYDVRLCLEDCGLCTKATPGVIERALNGLPIHRGRLTPGHLTALIDCCPTQALTVCDEMKSVEEIMTAIPRNKPFYDCSGGGLTLSGGEPFIQPETAIALLQASHEAGIYTAIKTCLHVPWKYIAPSLPYIGLFPAGSKHVVDAPSKQWTDGSAAEVLDNLEKLAAAGKKIVIRVPLTQSFNTDKTSVKTITDFTADELHVGEIHFLPYHTLGINKYHLFNLSYDAPEGPLDAPELFDFTQ